MKTSVDAVSGVERKITVEIPAEEVDRRIEREFTELRRMVPVRGFRKGKAPMEMVKRMFRDSVEAEVSEHLVKESLTEVVKEKDLKVLSMPGVEGAKVVPGKDFVFSATVEVVPEVEPVGYKGIPVARKKVSVTDEDVSAAVERLRESFAQFHAAEGRGAAEADLVDDAFAKQFGDVSGVDDIKVKVRERLVAEGEEHSRHDAEEALLKALAERNPFDVPATLVKRQTIAMMQDTFERLASQGVDLKKMNMDVDKMSERFAPNAERMVRVSLLIDAIARKENIDASYSEIDAEMKAMAEARGMEYGKVREMYSSEDRMDALRDRLLERKVLGFLMENAEVTEGAPE